MVFPKDVEAVFDLWRPLSKSAQVLHSYLLKLHATNNASRERARQADKRLAYLVATFRSLADEWDSCGLYTQSSRLRRELEPPKKLIDKRTNRSKASKIPKRTFGRAAESAYKVPVWRSS